MFKVIYSGQMMLLEVDRKLAIDTSEIYFYIKISIVVWRK